MTIKTIGSVVNTVGFEIDNKSWQNLQKFQARLEELKAKMESINKVGKTAFKFDFGNNPFKFPTSPTKPASDDSDRKKGIPDDDTRLDMINARLERFNAHMARLGKKLKSKDVLIFKKKMEDLNEEFKKGNMTSRMYAAQIATINSEMSKTARATRGFNQQFKDMRNLMIAGGVGYAVTQAHSAVETTGMSMDAIESKMRVGMGSESAAKEEMRYAADEADRLGMNLMNASENYAGLLIAAKGKLPIDQTRQLFKGMSELATATNISQERYKLASRAIEQMLNKATIMSEELKGQFAESMPGGIALFARALKVSEKELFKMMETGQVLAKDALPLVAEEMARTAREGGALNENMTNLRAATNRMQTTITALNNGIYEAGYADMMTQMKDSVSNLIRVLQPFINVVVGSLSVAITLVTIPFRALIAAIRDLYDLVPEEWQGTMLRLLNTLLGFALAVFIWKKVGSVIGGVTEKIKSIKAVVDVFNKLKNATGFMGMLGKMLMWIGRLAPLLTNPFTLAGIVIAGVIATVIAYWDEIKKFFSRLKGKITEFKNWLGFGDSKISAAITHKTASDSALGGRGFPIQNNVSVEITADEEGMGKHLQAKIQQGNMDAMNGLQQQIQANSTS